MPSKEGSINDKSDDVVVCAKCSEPPLEDDSFVGRQNVHCDCLTQRESTRKEDVSTSGVQEIKMIMGHMMEIALGMKVASESMLVNSSISKSFEKNA